VTQPVSGATRLAGIIGHPIAHTLSPAIHNAAYAACGLDWVYVAFSVLPGGAAAALEGMRALGLAGLSVTMPHKTDVAAACDELTPTAAALSAVNTVVPRDEGLLGDSTDGEGFLRSLRDAQVDISGVRFLVLGAGGAGRALAHSLGGAGAAVTVAARRMQSAQAAAHLAPGGTAIALGDVDDRLATVDVIVNATPVGMADEPPLFDVSRLTAQQFVYDTIYHPAETPLLAAARERGIPCANGLGMLVHQAALVFEIFTGEAAPLDTMRAAAQATGS
jgi:shikimate dehydrogenase